MIFERRKGKMATRFSQVTQKTVFHEFKYNNNTIDPDPAPNSQSESAPRQTYRDFSAAKNSNTE